MYRIKISAISLITELYYYYTTIGAQQCVVVFRIFARRPKHILYILVLYESVKNGSRKQKNNTSPSQTRECTSTYLSIHA